MRNGGVENKPNAGTGRGRNLQQKSEFEYFDYTGTIPMRGTKSGDNVLKDLYLSLLWGFERRGNILTTGAVEVSFKLWKMSLYAVTRLAVFSLVHT
jgi:hypothetical protein